MQAELDVILSVCELFMHQEQEDFDQAEDSKALSIEAMYLTLLQMRALLVAQSSARDYSATRLT